MTKTIKLSDKIPRVDIDHYLAASTEESRVCVLSERDITVIRSYLFPGVEWSTRFVRPLGGDNYETGTEEEFSEYLEELNELDYRLSGGFTMALEDALIAIANAITTAATANASAFNSIANSINIHANAQCCDTPFGSEGGVQGTIDTGDTGPIPIYGETPISYGREPGTYPPEFETEEGYLANRCAIANMIVDGVVGTLHGYAAFTVFNATALVALIALATASIIIMPPVAIPVMVGCILALVGFTTYFEGMANEIQANRQDYVCALYQGETIEIMISLLADFIDAILVTLGGAGWVSTILKQVFLLLNNPDTLKQLFDGVAGAAYEGADCSSCTEFSGCWNFDTDLEGFEEIAYGLEGGTVEWSDYPVETSMKLAGAVGPVGITVRNVIPEGYEQFQLNWSTDITNGPLSFSVIIWYDDTTVEETVISGNWAEGAHPNEQTSSNQAKTATHVGFYVAVGGGFPDGFEAHISSACLTAL